MSQAFPELRDFSDSPLEEGLSAPALAQSNIQKDGSPYQTRILFLYMHSATLPDIYHGRHGYTRVKNFRPV